MITAIIQAQPQYILGLTKLPNRVRWDAPEWLANPSPENSGFQLHDRYWAWLNLISTMQGDAYFRPDAYGLQSHFRGRLYGTGRLTENAARVFALFLPTTHQEYVWPLLAEAVQHGYLETALDIMGRRPANLAIDAYYLRPIFARCIMNNTEPFIRLTNALLSDPAFRNFFRNHLNDIVQAALHIDDAARLRVARRLFEIAGFFSQLSALSNADRNGLIVAILTSLTEYRFSREGWECSQEERAQFNTNILEMITRFPAITNANIKAAFACAVTQNTHPELALGLFNHPRGVCIDASDIAALSLDQVMDWVVRLPENRCANLDILVRPIQQAIHAPFLRMFCNRSDTKRNELSQNVAIQSSITSARQLADFVLQHARRFTHGTRLSLIASILAQNGRVSIFEETTYNGLIGAFTDATPDEIVEAARECITQQNRFSLLRLVNAYRDRLSIGNFLAIIQSSIVEARHSRHPTITDLLLIFRQKVGTTTLSSDEQHLLIQILERSARENAIFSHTVHVSPQGLAIHTPVASDTERGCFVWVLEHCLTRDQVRPLVGFLMGTEHCQKYYFLLNACQPSFFDEALRVEILKSVFGLYPNRTTVFLLPAHVEPILRHPHFRRLPTACVDLFLQSLKLRLQQSQNQTPLTLLLNLSQPGSLPDALFVGAIEAIVDHIMPINPNGNITRRINGNLVRCQQNSFSGDNLIHIPHVLTPLVERGPVFAPPDPNVPTQLSWFLVVMLHMGEFYNGGAVAERIYSYVRLPLEREECHGVFTACFVNKLPESFLAHATLEQKRRAFLRQCHMRNSAFFEDSNMQRVLSTCQNALEYREQINGVQRTPVDRVLEGLIVQVEQTAGVSTWEAIEQKSAAKRAISSILTNIPDSAISTLVSSDLVQRAFGSEARYDLSGAVRTKFQAMLNSASQGASSPSASSSPSSAPSSHASTAASSLGSSAVTPSRLASHSQPTSGSQPTPDEPSSIAPSLPRAALPQVHSTPSQAPLPIAPTSSRNALFAATVSSESTSSQDPNPIAGNGSIDPPDLTQLFPSDDYVISRSEGGAVSIRTRGGVSVSVGAGGISSVSTGGVRRSQRSPHEPTPPSSDSGLHPPALRSTQCCAFYAIGIILAIGCGLASGLGAAYGMKVVFTASFAGAGGAIVITLIAVACIRSQKDHIRISLG